MANIDLRFAVELETKQLEEVKKKMEKSDALLLKKIEKATTFLPKGIEKVDHAWLQIISKVSIYVDILVEYVKRGFDQICRKNCKANQESLYYERSFIRATIAAAKKHKLAMKRISAIRFLLLSRSEGVIVKSLPQYLQTIASSFISSAQYGHFFITNLYLKSSLCN